MTALWAWRRDARVATALWPAIVGAVAVMYANVGDGAWARRSAIAWMMGSWGARLAVQSLYTLAGPTALAPRALRWRDAQYLAAAAVICSTPALLASLNRDPDLSRVELVACAMWVVGFAGETTADRQRLRFSSNPANDGLPCRIGLWRYAPHVDRIFEALIWIAYLVFACAAVTGAGPFHLSVVRPERDAR
jgi:steroid 5-alpha reductase family enzyme